MSIPRAAGMAIPLWILTALVAALVLRETQALLVPVALACLLACALYPVVLWLERLHVPLAAGATLVVLGLATLTAWTAWSLKDDFGRVVSDLPQQLRELRHQLEREGQTPTLARLRESLVEMRKAAGSAQNMGGRPPAAQPSSPPPADSSSDVQNYVWQGSSNLVAIAGQITVIVFLLFFLLIGARGWRRRLMALPGARLSSRRTVAEVLDDINDQVQRFLFVRVITAVFVGIATWIALRLLGAPAPGLWGAAAGVFNSVPYFGPVIVSGGLALVGLFAGGFIEALKYSGVALLITALEGWLITPPLLGKAARMNTLAVFLSLLFWSWAWDIWGAVLAIPMMTVIKAVSDHVESLQPISTLLSDDSA